MEIRQTKGWILDIYNDEILGLCYLKVLTEQRFESLKLPTSWQKYKLAHLIRPDYFLDLELVKTRKNWVLKQILGYQVLFSLVSYKDFLKIRDLQKILLNYLYEGQEVSILSWLESFFSQTTLEHLPLDLFEKKLKQQLGFA